MSYALNEEGFWCDKTEDGHVPAGCETKAGTSYCHKECEFHADEPPEPEA